MLHIRTRYGKILCGNSNGSSVTTEEFVWQPKDLTCRECAKRYRERRSGFISKLLEMKLKKQPSVYPT